MRYKSNTVINTIEGKRYYDTTVYPKIEPSENDFFHTSVVGDRLDTLARTFYGKVSLWWVIALANNLGKGTLAIDPGTELRIPFNIGKIEADLDRLNENR